MDDLISRQTAIDAINGLPKWIDTEHGVCLDYADVIAVLSEHLPSALSQWTLCNEQPPKEYGDYLVTWKNGTVSMLSYYDVDAVRNIFGNYVKAWMPLPKAYEVTE